MKTKLHPLVWVTFEARRQEESPRVTFDGLFFAARGGWCVEQVACALFLLNAALALILLPSGNGREVGGWTDAAAGAKKKTDDVFLTNFKKACSSGPTLRILAAKLIYGFLMRALGSQNFVG